MPQTTYPVPAHSANNAHINAEDYRRLYAQSVENPDEFWGRKATLLDWDQPFETVKNTSFVDEVSIKWFEGGQLNVAANCLDRHLANRADEDAFIFIPDEADAPAQHISYAELHARVCRCANMLKKLGVKAEDRVTIYMPMVPEAAIAMLACARIGAIHSVVFGGFSPSSLRNRIEDCQSRIVITANEGVRGGKTIPLKENVDKALEGVEVDHVLVFKRTDAATNMQNQRDLWWHDLEAGVDADCPAQPFDAEHPLFILYTSGSTGKPKGLLHSSAGYLLYAQFTFQTVFDYKQGEIYWCTADVGWITGHSYMIYGPLAAGATSVLFEGVPNYPDAGRFWREVARLRVNSFYTAPTAIRMLMGAGDDYVTRHDRSSLRILGSVGEPINPEAWRWYHERVGEERCRIVDTWWQTETGGHLITPLPGATPLKPGCATQPFFGVQPALLTAEQNLITGAGEGALCIADSWPGQARTIWGDHARFIDTYFAPYPGYYFSGDGAKRDDDGDYWILGRMDDVLNVSGHRLGTAEIESALVAHEAVTEAAVVGFPHHVKGEAIYAFVTLHPAAQARPEDALKTTLRQWVREQIGPIASPEMIQFSPALPKTRSGKIMRRILRKIAAGDVKNNADYAKLGDISTLLNPEAVDDLVAGATGGGQ